MELQPDPTIGRIIETLIARTEAEEMAWVADDPPPMGRELDVEWEDAAPPQPELH